MIQIKIYKEKQYYRNKWGDKEYLEGGAGDSTLVKAAMLTGKGLNTEEECIYVAYGETEAEAEKSLSNYLQANDNIVISRKEVVK
jgi:hypothetical protein